MKNPDEFSWHSLSREEVCRHLETELEFGLADQEITRRLEIYGPNRLTSQVRTSAFKKFLLQFHAPLVYILLAAVGVTLALEEFLDSIVILAVVVANAIAGFIQESRAEKAMDALSRLVITEATVRRGGRKHRIASEELVPGDVVLLQSGDKVPADLRLLHVRNLQIDESALTGESVPVFKASAVLSEDTVLAERKNMAYAGTHATYGQAEGVVMATGNETETGRIARLIRTAADLATPLTRKIASFSKLLLAAILGLAALTFVVGLARGNSAVETFMAAVALAVGAIPEGLPAAVTITLAIGVSRMARRQAIIRKLPSVETLGSTTVICSDKTGTLTENQMTVQEAYAGGTRYRLTGTGYSLEGQIVAGDEPLRLEEHEALAECLKAGLLCNDTQLVFADSRWKVEGDPTEAALIVAARKAGFSHETLHQEHPRLDVIPFQSESQYMATLHGRGEGNPRVIFKKGAVEKLLQRCHHVLQNDGRHDPIDRAALERAAESMAAQGLRVLALARREMPHDQNEIQHHHVAGELVFLGLLGMMDPPRAEAKASVQRCQKAGIQVKMITGDHVLTARAIAAQLGIGEQSMEELTAVNGRELENTPDRELPAVAERTSVFARVAPEQKLRLVKALQSLGHIVAMTGDGVNDAPALKQADIGVAMGKGGTDVAKNAADVVLADDNFATIEAAVEEGRGVFDNLIKFIVWTLPTNAGEGLTILLAILLGTALPVEPVQLLWINMTTALLLGLMLVFEPKEKNLMQRPPRNPKMPILTFPLLMRSGLVTLIMLIGSFGLFWWARRVEGMDLAHAQTIVMNVIVMVELCYMFNCRFLLRPVFGRDFLANRWVFVGAFGMMAAQLAMTYVPFMNVLFHTAPLSPADWGRIIAVALSAFAAVEVEKWIRLKLGRGTTV